MLSIPPRAPQTDSQARLAALAASSVLGVGVPVRLEGHGRHLGDLFRDPTARHWQQGLRHADLLLFHSQRMVIEALVNTDNIVLQELQQPGLLASTMAGASTLESPALDAKTMGLGWQFHRPLRGAPNLQWEGFSLLLPVQAAGRVEGLLLVCCEENGLTLHPGETPALRAFTAYGDLHFHKASLRADKWLGDQTLRETLIQAHKLLHDGLHLHRR